MPFIFLTLYSLPPDEFAIQTTAAATSASESDVLPPLAEVKVAEAATEKTGDSGSISGEKIAQKNCALCHSSGMMNSPKIGDKEQWAPRIAQGKEMLVNNAIKGIGVMPAKGGNTSLSDAEVAAAVVWMANSSGGSL